MSLCALPDEILLPILNELSFHDRHQNVALVSKRFLRLSRVPAELHNLKLDIDENGLANFNPELLSLHGATKVLDINMDCCRTCSHVKSAHKALMEGLATYEYLTSLRIHGQCCNLYETFKDIDPSKLAMITRIDLGFPSAHFVQSKFLGFPSAHFVLSKFNDLKEVSLFGDFFFLQALSDALQMFAPTLERLRIEVQSDDDYFPLDFWPQLRDHVIENCPRLEYIHLPFSKDYWDSMSEVKTLKSIGVSMTTTDYFKQPVQLCRQTSPKLAELILDDNLDGVIPLRQLSKSLPERQIKKVQFKLRQEKTPIIGFYLMALANGFPELEELIWEQDLKSTFPARTGYFQKTLALNPPEFRKLTTIAMPYNSEVPLFKYCPNFSQLTLTWNDNVITTEDLFSDMMTDLFNTYGSQIELLSLEQNPQRGFRIPDQFMSLLQYSCPHARIQVHFK